MLVDGTGVAYRAYHAIARLSTRAGRPTNALFGFIKMHFQLQELWRPTHGLVVFDGGVPGERLERLPEYKAQRAPMPDDLRGQLESINEFLARARVPAIRMEGQEADDVMATLAGAASSAGAEVLLVSSDKDLYQLVNDRVCVAPPSRAGARMGAAEIREKTGVEPAHIVEWLALMGDAVDNIPGVPGVGPKTAAGLLADFGSLSALWARLGEVSQPKLREALAANRARVESNLELVRLRRDLPVEMDWDAAVARAPEPSRLAPFYRDMEFHSLLRDLEGAKPSDAHLDFGLPT